MNQSISVGVFDWVNFPSQAEFYPDDLPEEWRLVYFSNEFNSACVKLAGLETNLQLLCEWVEDLPTSFELCLYVEHIGQISMIQTLLQQEGCQIDALISDPQEDYNLLQKPELQSLLSSSTAVCPPSICEYRHIWTPENRVTENNRFAIIPVADNMRQNRQWIEQWLKDTESSSHPESKSLWLSGAHASYQQLSEIRTLIELMGC
jgi:hypothetical protein